MPRIPKDNVGLRLLLAQTGWTGEEFARAVNAVGWESGLRLHYQRASVSQWLTGTRPRPPVPLLIAEALSRRLGRPVGPAETGLGAPATVPADPDAPDGAAGPGGGAADRYDPGPLRAVTAAVYRPADLDLLPPRSGVVRPRPPGDGGGERLGARHVACVEELTAQFSHSDHLTGSGTVLRALTGFTTDVALPWLRLSATPVTRRALLGSCARLVILGGFLHVDHGRHGAAQQWYRTAAELADESGEPHTLALVLRALSLQAHGLGHHGAALRLAERALGLAARSDPRTLAFLHGQLALARAAVGLRREAVGAIRQAERELERATGPWPSLGGYNAAALAYQRAEVRQCLGDHEGALADLRLSVRLRPTNEARSQALVLARLGELQLAAGELDGACLAWERFLAVRTGLDSRRVDEAQATMRTALLPHRRSPHVAHLLHSPPGRTFRG
ncbi:tetratricopeptide repeat protein [Kitasatospora sp. NPDC096147]|uniref:tetratricopeptide repeat protein n=1 Tax=Kitasatospora sp. NPDC096147 TaxID=3364093 RepID=UPI0038188D4E